MVDHRLSVIALDTMAQTDRDGDGAGLSGQTAKGSCGEGPIEQHFDTLVQPMRSIDSQFSHHQNDG
jgi:hypothetical protein